MKLMALENRKFLRRAVHYLAAEAGIVQFLDIGTGLPPRATSTRSPSRSPRAPGSCTPTTTVASRVVHTRAGLLGLPEANAEALRAFPECSAEYEQQTRGTP